MPKLVERVRAAAFDLDGTLVDSAPDLAAAANAMLESLGHMPLPESRVRAMIGAGVERLIERALTESAGAGPGTEALAAAGEVFRRQYARQLFQLSRVYPGVEEALDRLLQAGLRLCCVTNKHSDFALPLLEAAGLGYFFEFTLCADSQASRKPDPALLLESCRRFKVRPEELLCVGDSAADVGAARAAGCPVVAVSYGYNGGRPIALEHPDWIVGGLPEISGLSDVPHAASARA